MNYDYCYLDMPKINAIILKYNHGQKAMKAPFVIYADLECLLNKIYTCHNNPKKSSTSKEIKHNASGYSSFTLCSFDVTSNKHVYYRGKYCMKKFCKDLRKLATKIINYDKKEMIPFTVDKNKSHYEQKVC